MKKVLIVDDELHIQVSLGYIMRDAGFEVFTASDGQEGLEVAFREKPDVVFLDLMMPVKNGFEFCEELRENKEFDDTYIVLLTARGQQEDKKKAIELGANEYITKPFSPRKLVEKIKKTLH